MKTIVKIAKMKSAKRVVRWCATAALIGAMLPSRLAAQGCAMCYQATAAAGRTAQAGLRHGILILLVPALGLFATIVRALYARRGPDM